MMEGLERKERKEYYMEIYFYKKEGLNRGLQEIPDLDEYKKETEMIRAIAKDFRVLKREIEDKNEEVAYINLIETRILL